jgi:hypothetical protein
MSNHSKRRSVPSPSQEPRGGGDPEGSVKNLDDLRKENERLREQIAKHGATPATSRKWGATAREKIKRRWAAGGAKSAPPSPAPVEAEEEAKSASPSPAPVEAEEEAKSASPSPGPEEAGTASRKASPPPPQAEETKSGKEPGLPPASDVWTVLAEAAERGTGGEVVVCGPRDRVGRVFFIEAKLVWIHLPSAKENLSEVLVKEAGLGAEDFALVQQECQNTGSNLFDILTSWGLMSEDRVRALLQSRFSKLLSRMLAWKDAQALFVPEPPLYTGSVFFDLDEFEHLPGQVTAQADSPPPEPKASIPATPPEPEFRTKGDEQAAEDDAKSANFSIDPPPPHASKMPHDPAQRLPRLGEILVGLEYLSRAELNEILEKQQRSRRRVALGQLLLTEGVITREQLENATMKQMDLLRSRIRALSAKGKE